MRPNAGGSRTLRVLAWVPQELDTTPGQRFRFEQWAPRLLEHGIEITWSPFMDNATAAVLKRRGAWLPKARGVSRALLRRLNEVARARDFDLVYMFREGAILGPALAERRLTRAGVPYVFDFDDAVWVRYVSPANSVLSFLRFPGKTATLCRNAAHVMAGNPYLADYARHHNPRVTVVPTTIDLDVYRMPPVREAARPVIGWTGSYSTVQYLALVRSALERLRQRHDFRVVVVGGDGFHAESVEVENRPWRAATEVADLSDFDIGLMPLPDSPWEQGKCGLKALQYMALGVPAVVSPVAVNRDIVAHDVNGLWATTSEEWEHALESLLVEPGLRRRLGQAGRRTVEDRYSATSQAPRVAEILRTAAGARPRPL